MCSGTHKLIYSVAVLLFHQKMTITAKSEQPSPWQYELLAQGLNLQSRIQRLWHGIV